MADIHHCTYTQTPIYEQQTTTTTRRKKSIKTLTFNVIEIDKIVWRKFN